MERLESLITLEILRVDLGFLFVNIQNSLKVLIFTLSWTIITTLKRVCRYEKLENQVFNSIDDYPQKSHFKNTKNSNFMKIH